MGSGLALLPGARFVQRSFLSCQRAEGLECYMRVIDIVETPFCYGPWVAFISEGNALCILRARGDAIVM